MRSCEKNSLTDFKLSSQTKKLTASLPYCFCCSVVYSKQRKYFSPRNLSTFVIKITYTWDKVLIYSYKSTFPILLFFFLAFFKFFRKQILPALLRTNSDCILQNLCLDLIIKCSQIFSVIILLNLTMFIITILDKILELKFFNILLLLNQGEKLFIISV